MKSVAGIICKTETGRDEEYSCFFFSSRRRHTRFDCDWSSDVCSSDLLSRLASRGVLTFTPASGRNPYQYRVAMDTEQFVAWSIRRDAQRMVERYGELALKIGRASCRERV